MDYLQYFDHDHWYVLILHEVLNLVINGLPSIQRDSIFSFTSDIAVLNLVINGLPSIRFGITMIITIITVLNLVINGLPSIQKMHTNYGAYNDCFKPCYKWITFNT